MICTNCGYEITTGKKFCKRCGKMAVDTNMASNERVLPATSNQKGQYVSNEITLPTPQNSILADPKPSVLVPITPVTERIRKSTQTGGLQTLPEGFDDKEGDWITVRSNNLLERLYLDYQLYKQITPETVKGNYEILSRFWQEKVDLLNRGQGRVQILSKYDPEHKSEEVIKSFPRRLKEAFDVLSKPDGIRSYFNELDKKRKEKGEDALKEIIDTALADGILEPTETHMIFDKGKNTELNEDEIAEILTNRLKKHGFYPIGNPIGTTSKHRLFSVKWFTQAKYAEWQRDQLPQLPTTPVQLPQPIQAQLLPTTRPNQQHTSQKILFPMLIGGMVVVIGVFIILFNSSSKETVKQGNDDQKGPFTQPISTEGSSSLQVEITNILNSWAASLRNRDIDKHMSYYADKLDTYYGASNISTGKVRSDILRAYSKYSTVDVQIGNIKITPDSSGVHATAVFDKTWNFKNDQKQFSGSVQYKIWFTKMGNGWRITGEKDLQVYAQ